MNKSFNRRKQMSKDYENTIADAINGVSARIVDHGITENKVYISMQDDDYNNPLVSTLNNIDISLDRIASALENLAGE
jgi:hypothetical protein